MRDEPGNQRDKQRFAALTDNQQTDARRHVAQLLQDGGMTEAACWKQALNTVEQNPPPIEDLPTDIQYRGYNKWINVTLRDEVHEPDPNSPDWESTSQRYRIGWNGIRDMPISGVDIERGAIRAARAAAYDPVRVKKPSRAQLADLIFYAGGPTPRQQGVRINGHTTPSCVEAGWLTPTDESPFNAVTDAGREILREYGHQLGWTQR